MLEKIVSISKSTRYFHTVNGTRVPCTMVVVEFEGQDTETGEKFAFTKKRLSYQEYDLLKKFVGKEVEVEFKKINENFTIYTFKNIEIVNVE